MGIETALIVSAVAGAGASVHASNVASRATREGINAIKGAPGRGLRAYAALEEQLGGAPTVDPDMFRQAQFFGLGADDIANLSQSMFQQQTALVMPQFEDALQLVDQDMAKRGFASSIDDETRFRLADRLMQNMLGAAAGSNVAATTLFGEEQARRTAFGQTEAQRETAFNMSPIDIWFNRAQLGQGAMGQAGQNAANLAQVSQQGANAQANIWGGFTSNMQNLASSYGAWQALKGPTTGFTGGVTPTEMRDFNIASQDAGFTPWMATTRSGSGGFISP